MTHLDARRERSEITAAAEDHDLVTDRCAGDAQHTQLVGEPAHLVARVVDDLELTRRGRVADPDERGPERVPLVDRVPQQIARVGQRGRERVRGRLADRETTGELRQPESLFWMCGKEVEQRDRALG